MLVFTNSKINLGLNVIEKRPDGFHNIQTVLYPVNWADSLELVETNRDSNFNLHVSGLNSAAIRNNDNILHKAYRLISNKYKIPAIDVYLHKMVPMGAGLGGGSSDAVFFIKLLNDKFNLNIPENDFLKMLAGLGSDCSFFLKNRPVYAIERGDVFEEVSVNLSKYHILIAWPGIISNTKEAYAMLQPKFPEISLKDIILNEPIEKWRGLLNNDFEVPIFEKYPEIKTLKEQMYSAGAIYSCMSGSGSAVYGIFEKKPSINLPDNYMSYLEEPCNERLV